MLKIALIVLIYIASLNAGLNVGKNYHYDQNKKLELEKTTLDEALKRFGEPVERHEIKTSKGDYVFLRYYMSDIKFRSGKSRVTQLQFKNGVLFSYFYGSNYNKDNSNFNYKKSKTIKVGDNIRDVVKKIGKPTGKGVCPLNTGKFAGFCRKGRYTYAWFYLENFGLKDKVSVANIFLVGVDKNYNVVEVAREKRDIDFMKGF